MNTKRQNRVMLVLLSLACVLAVAASLFATGINGFVKADDQALYTQDFESLSTDLNGDGIYESTGLAGGTRSIVQSTGTYIKAPYQFFDNGCQNGHVYTNTDRVIPSTVEGKDYTLTMRVKPYGDFVNVIIAVQGPDTSKCNSVIILPSGATGYAENYAGASFVTVNSAVLGTDGWYDVNATVKGSGGYVMLLFYMNVEKTRYAEINAADATGICIETLKFADGNTTAYEMNIVPGLTGEAAIFGACGLAGFRDIAQTRKDGINGKTLRAKLDFFSTAEGGWQREPLYYNENKLGITLEQDKTYYVDYTVRMFGKAQTAVCMFQQIGANVDSQVILNADKSYSTAEYGAVKIFDGVEVKVNGDEFKVSAKVKGAGKPFKLMFNMLSSDADAANAGADTGVYLDDVSIKTEKAPEADVTDGEYKTVLSRNFNNDPLDVSGSDAMFHTNGFAGVVGGQLTIKEDGFNGDRCLSAMFAYNDDGWQKANLYLDSGKLGSTADGKIYRWDMQIKPVGTIDYVYIGFESEKPVRVTDYVYLKNGEAFAETAASGSKLVKYVLNGYADGVYNVSIYMQGNGGYTFNFINAHCTAPASANENKDTGILLDNYSISVKKEKEPAGFNVTGRFYNLYNAKDLVIASTFTDVAGITVDGTALSEENYAFENGVFTIKASYLATLSAGSHAIVATNVAGEQSVLTIAADNIPTGEIYNNDFSAMPDLNGDQTANDTFFQNSWFDPANYAIYTEGAENRVIKFVPKAIDESNVGLFQTNPNEGRMHYLTKGKRHTLSVDLKPEDNGVIALRGLTHDAQSDVEFFFMEIDVKTGKLVSGTQNADICYDVTAKADGWYRLSVSFRYTEDNGLESYAYVQFMAAAPTMTSVWYMDNFVAESELFAELVSTETRYDKASATRPYAIVNLNQFEIVSVNEGENVLKAGEDYVIEVTPTGSYRIDLTEAFCKKYDLGDKKTITVVTSKNVITFDFAVIDSAPVLNSEASCDLAEKADLKIAADLKGYEISLVDADGANLGGTEYMYNSDGEIVFKYNYLKGLTVGKHTFVIHTTSGAQATLVITVADTTPVFEGGEVYEKADSADYTVKLNLFGKEITEVRFDGTVLGSEDYSYENGTLTIKSSVFAAKNAGKYGLSVKTVAERTLEIEVRDVPPVIDGEYEVVKGNALVLNVNLNGREIVSVMLGELVLTSADYSYENGKLTVNAEVLEELASGEQVITLTTAGGTVRKTFAVKDKTVEEIVSGCSSTLGGSGIISIIMVIAATAFVVGINRKKQSR